MAEALSPWAATAIDIITGVTDDPLFSFTVKDITYDLHHLNNSLWIVANLAKNVKAAFRTAYAPDKLSVKNTSEKANGIVVNMTSFIGEYKVEITFTGDDSDILHYNVQLVPDINLYMPFWPRDIIITNDKGDTQKPTGEIHISQTGTRSGLIYASFTRPKAGSMLYFQNLTALAEYHIDTQTSAADNVGGQWPELGLSLPAAVESPLQAGKRYTLSDAWVIFNNHTPADQFEVAKDYLNSLAGLYVQIPKPETKYHDFPDILKKALYDLQNNKGCWTYHNGHPYLNAYVCDYFTPPEIMVQLAVLLPVQDYMKWSGESCIIEKEIIGGLPAFYDDKVGTIMRWLPAQEGMLDESEEQKTPKLMDSWYLHHPLLNLARMAKGGDKMAKDLLLKSADYAIKVARNFNYKWPVFYQMETLEVVKAETKEGEGGEKDVAGLYAHVMLQIWEITKDKKYFKEAEKAAQSLVQYGFDIFYQANNTMFGAKAMMLLYKETRNELYLNLSYLLLANVFKNVALWECSYGYGPHFPNFFSVFPLNDAPYTAVYEEQEVFSGVHELLSIAQGIEILPSASLLLAELVRHFVHRSVFYYPPMLPKEMIAEEIKTGEVDPNLWVALEDIHDGWEKSGEVGQEVYGAGLAFGIVPRQYIQVPNANFLIFIDYPVIGQTLKNNTVSFDVLGSSQLCCRLCIVKTDKGKLPEFKVMSGNAKDQEEIDGKSRKDRHEFILHGGQKVIISWK